MGHQLGYPDHGGRLVRIQLISILDLIIGPVSNTF